MVKAAVVGCTGKLGQSIYRNIEICRKKGKSEY